MSVYVVGDIHGHFEELTALLNEINFDHRIDKLVSVGDLVNRGPMSLETIRFCKNLGKSFDLVLGNHDLHLLALVHSAGKRTNINSLEALLCAPDLDEIVGWMTEKSLMLIAEEYSIVHAGIAPTWDIEKAFALSLEVQSELQSENAGKFFKNMYGNTPDLWNDELEGVIRLRVITNYLTRMRLCSETGELDFKDNNPKSSSTKYAPWFKHRKSYKKEKIIFGHWATLDGKFCTPTIHALDTGCAWGRKLRIMDIDNEILIEYKSNN